MLRGVNTLALDAKGRLAIPTRYRDRLAERCAGQLVVTVDRDHCLLLYPLPDWEDLERKLVRLPSLNKQARRLQRLLIGHATELELDSHGRVLLPGPLRQFAELDRRVVLIGQGNKFELWDEDIWNERRDGWLAEVDEDELSLPAELGQLSL
ncbi:MAG TPA: division/cell wall cluster transcriptional repressor MraZ [Gammaproteobacteria bacterium]|nr:division/cell wall cluster transcriptional repressor MraZ [Gammaproteobacteria bacterium]HET7586615.1 division/cell wall cluster transcriptional repressor MraZ [Gammaproteobacteria bacterium]